jgi:hypothetical protein
MFGHHGGMTKTANHFQKYIFYSIEPENAQEFSAILLHYDEAVNCLAYDYNKHKISNCRN